MGSKASTELRNSGLGKSFSIEGFWGFIVERHQIWHRRTILEQPAPWTDDEILQKFFFCNVFRNYDRGTAWYIAHIANAWTNQTLADALWKTITYRLVNSVSAFEAAGRVAPRQARHIMISTMRRKGIVLNSRAYITLPRPHGPKFRNRVDRLEAVLDKLNLGFDGLVHSIQEAKTLEEVSYCLKQEYGIGPFLSLQIYRDLILARQIPFTDDDWVEVGPGAKLTLIELYGKQAHSVACQREIIRELAIAQYPCLDSRGWNEFESAYLSICDIEHCLCEYGKYAKLAAGRGRRRYYRR